MHWVNSYTEIGKTNGKYGAKIYVGHQVFKDKNDGKWKKNKLTDERPTKDYILMQSAKCCSEIYPYYAVYYDVDHEGVRVHDSRWVVEVWTGNRWKDLGFWNPTLYVEPIQGGIKVVREGQTTDGILNVEFIQMDGLPLKHKVTWTNISAIEKTVRIIFKWSGILGSKVNNLAPPVTINDFVFFFGSESEVFMGENLAKQFTNGVLNPVSVEVHADGMKVDFQFEEYIVLAGDNIVIDPETWSNGDPTEDGHVYELGGTYTRASALNTNVFGRTSTKAGIRYNRAYVEWNIDGIPDTAVITVVKFQYEGATNNLVNDTAYIYSMENRPSTASDSTVWADCKNGTAYVSGSVTFPEVGTNKEIDLGVSAVNDLQEVIATPRGWWAIGCVTDETENTLAEFYSEEYVGPPTPKPTLYVEYSYVKLELIRVITVS